MDMVWPKDGPILEKFKDRVFQSLTEGVIEPYFSADARMWLNLVTKDLSIE